MRDNEPIGVFLMSDLGVCVVLHELVQSVDLWDGMGCFMTDHY